MRYSTPTTHHKRSFSVKLVHQTLPSSRAPFITRRDPKANKSPVPMTSDQELTQILKRHYDKNYIRELVQYYSHEWDEQMQELIEARQLMAVSCLVLQRISMFRPLLGSLMNEIDCYNERQFRVLLGVNYKEYGKLVQSFEVVFRLTSQYTSPAIIGQRQDLQKLYITVLRLYNPTGIGSQQELKEKFDSFMGVFKSKKSQLASTINSTLRPTLDFVVQIERVIDYYQKEAIKYRDLFEACSKQKRDAVKLLQKKTNFVPVEIDYIKIKDIKDEHKKEIMLDFDQNIVKFYKNRMKTYDKKIEDMKGQIDDLNKEISIKNELITNLKIELNKTKNAKALTKDSSTQISLFTQPSASHQMGRSMGYEQFIENVNSPFKFTPMITSSFIHQLVLDKILSDYKTIQNKSKLKSFKHFVFEWFIIKTGCKVVAQIFCKNFILSIKSLRKSHKRYELAAKLMGITQVKQRSLVEDLELVFCQTQLAWYYYLKVLIMYRIKLNVNNSGFPIIPPVNCEQVMKLPLRKTYEIVNEFIQEEGLPKNSDVNTKFDLYCINEISLFKQGTEQFQKQRKQEIHILGQITFDTIAGFLIEYAGNIRCANAEKFLRAIQTKVREKNTQLSYTEFQLIYKKIYKERRSKAESLYAKFVMTKQEEALDLDNMNEVVLTLLQEQIPIRTAFQKISLLKDLVLDDKASMNWQIEKKTTAHANAYQNFRERYYMEFYDFYSSVRLLYHIFKSIRKLLNKFLKDEMRKQNITLGDQEESNDEEEHEEYAEKIQKMQNSRTPELDAEEKARKKSALQAKVEEFKILLTKIPIFPKKIITIDQLVVHAIRRKDSIDITEYSWRVLREILILITEKNLKN